MTAYLYIYASLAAIIEQVDCAFATIDIPEWYSCLNIYIRNGLQQLVLLKIQAGSDYIKKVV